MQTDHYGAHEAPSTPGAVQRRIPLTVAAGARKGLRLAVTYGDNWVTTGPTGGVVHTPESVLNAARRQVEVLDEVLAAAGRDRGTLGRVLLWMPTEAVIESADQFDELAAPYASLGFDQFVLHHPDQTGPWSGSVKAFEEIAARYAAG